MKNKRDALCGLFDHWERTDEGNVGDQSRTPVLDTVEEMAKYMRHWIKIVGELFIQHAFPASTYFS